MAGLGIGVGMESIDDHRSFRSPAAYHDYYTYRGICIEMYVVVVVVCGVYEYCVSKDRRDRMDRVVVVVVVVVFLRTRTKKQNKERESESDSKSKKQKKKEQKKRKRTQCNYVYNF